MYRFSGPPDGVAGKGGRVRLVGSGSILQQVVAAQALLGERFGVAAEVYSAPSFQQLRRDALDVDRWNRLHPDAKARVPYVRTILGADGGPIVAATDWLKALPDLVRPWLAGAVRSCSGPRASAAATPARTSAPCFEIDAANIAAAALSAWPGRARCRPSGPRRRIADLGIDPEKTDPLAL